MGGVAYDFTSGGCVREAKLVSALGRNLTGHSLCDLRALGVTKNLPILYSFCRLELLITDVC